MIQCHLAFLIFTLHLSHGKEAYIEAVIRGSATLPCPVQPEDKNDSLLLVLWYKADDNNVGNSPIYSYDARLRNGVATKWSSDKAFGPRAYFLTSMEPAGLLIANIAPKDGGVYICRTDFRTSPTKNYKIVLDVLIPPGPPKIFDGGGSEIHGVAGPYHEGSIVEFSCISNGGTPTPVISWYYNDIHIYSNDKNGRPKNKIKIRLLKQDFGAVLSCEAKNSNLTDVARKSFTIDILLPPASTKILTSGKPLSAGKEYELVCQSSGSNPPATITWWKGEEQLKNALEKEENGQIVSRLKFIPQWEDNEKNIECRASNMSMDDETLEDILELTVYYKPYCSFNTPKILKIVSPSPISIRSEVEAYPEAMSFTWIKNSTGKVLGKSQQLGDTSTVVINPINFGYSETFLSLATNEIGRQLTPCVFHVFYEGPPQRPENCTLAQPHSAIYTLTCLPPVRHQPDYYLLQVQDVETSDIIFNITSSIPKFTLIVKEPNGFMSKDLRFDTVVSLGKKKVVSRLFGVNHFGISGSIDIFINEEGVAHLKQEKLDEELIIHALVIGCICLCTAVIAGILLLLMLKKLFRSKKTTRPTISPVVDKDSPQLNIPLCPTQGKFIEVQKQLMPNETEL